MVVPAVIILTVAAAFVVARFGPKLGLNVAPLMIFASLFLIVLGAGLILVDVRNGNASTGLVLGSALAAFGMMKFRQLRNVPTN